MIVPYTELPGGTESEPRPIIDIAVADVASVRIPCLVESGALNTLLPAWVAEVADVDLADATAQQLSVGGTTTTARFTTVSISTEELAWEASVGFCDPWPYAWGILGHRSFLRWFTVTFRAADHEFELEPIRA